MEPASKKKMEEDPQAASKREWKEEGVDGRGSAFKGTGRSEQGCTPLGPLAPAPAQESSVLTIAYKHGRFQAVEVDPPQVCLEVQGT